MRVAAPAWLRGRVRPWLLAPPLALVLLAVSLEEVTESPPPLDPRFYAGGGSDPSVGGGAGQVPFAGHEGRTVRVSGTLEAPRAGALELDLWGPDPAVPGGRTHLGKVPVAGPGPFSLEVPAGFGALQIESFLDRGGDGPSADDPFGRVDLSVGQDPVEGLRLCLAEGAMAAVGTGAASQAGGAPVHVEAPPGAPGGGERVHVEAAPGQPGGGEHEHVEAPPGAPGGDGLPHAGAGAAGGAADPFAAADGARVRLSGTIAYGDPAVDLDLDVFRDDPDGPGGRAFAGKKKVRAGRFELSVPVAWKSVSLEAFLDRASDGPSPEDPFGTCDGNPIRLDDGDVDGLRIALEAR